MAVVSGSTVSLISLCQSCQESLGYSLPDQSQEPVEGEVKAQLDSDYYSCPSSTAGSGQW